MSELRRSNDRFDMEYSTAAAAAAAAAVVPFLTAFVVVAVVEEFPRDMVSQWPLLIGHSGIVHPQIL